MKVNSYDVNRPKAGKKAGSNFIIPAITVCGIIMSIILLSVFFTNSEPASPCLSAPTAVSNGRVTSCAGSVSGGTCRPSCNAGKAPDGIDLHPIETLF